MVRGASTGADPPEDDRLEALNLHKGYWTLTGERTQDIDGAVVLGPLAMACLAYDGKLPFGVESPFVPKCLLEYAWCGGFPT
ncbi:Imm49 family immunity protein [Streptomyces virginiae]|uniref:Imm49 family immunity protein n=1 Tax=Streptomyces virginiae TaxID=1961 RepID=UPI0033B615CC